MLISEKNQSLLVDKKFAPWVQAAIPHAIPYKDWLVVPHKMEETRVLRNLGFAPPSPIERYYKWPGRFTPFDHQRATAAFLTFNKRAFVLNDIGTGKTMAAYWAADYLMKIGLVRRVGVVSPLSSLERTHGDAIFTNLTHRTFAILHGTRGTRQKLLKHRFDFYIINHDGIESVQQEIVDRTDIDLWIIDELAVLRNPTTKRWKTMKSVLRPDQTVWGMTGGPTPNDPTDAYGQVKLVNPSRLEHVQSMRSFKLATMNQVSMFKWVPKPDAMKTVHTLMQPSVRYTRSECLDLPPITYQTRDVPLTAEQQHAYDELIEHNVVAIKGGQVTALNEGVLMMRLVQVVNGVVYDTEHNHLVINCKPRMDVLKEIIEEAAQKVIVYVPFTGSLRMLEAQLTPYWSTATVDGSVSAHRRNEIFKAFQECDDPRVLIAHPQCMSHSLTLTEASTIVWWAPFNSNEIFEQANGRIERAGQENKMLVVMLAGTKVEKKMYDNLQRKQKQQGVLLSLYE